MKGTFLLTHYFIPNANATYAAVIGLISGVFTIPAGALPGLSGLISSKIGVAKLLEFLAAEKPNLFVASLHPGMVETDIFKKSGAKKEMLPMDTPQLPAHYLAWLASPQAAFLKGKCVYANWDVEELKEQSENIEAQPILTAGLIGWPFAHTG